MENLDQISIDLTKVEVRKLQAGDEKAFIDAYTSWPKSDRGFTFSHYWENSNNFEEYLEILKRAESGEGLPDDHVASTSVFAFYQNQVIGRVSIRHELNEFLKKIGGHIGYGVLPKYRGQGVAKLLLVASLEKCRELEMKEVLVTCDEDNLASKRVIEACGGVYENTYSGPDFPKSKFRYWIEI